MATGTKISCFSTGPAGQTCSGRHIPRSRLGGTGRVQRIPERFFRPRVIREWHSSFLSAGATVLETNTFGANKIVCEYGLADRVEEINRAAVENAREAIRRHGGPAYVAGSIGPTTSFPSLGARRLRTDGGRIQQAHSSRPGGPAGRRDVPGPAADQDRSRLLFRDARTDEAGRSGDGLLTIESTGMMLADSRTSPPPAAIPTRSPSSRSG